MIAGLKWRATLVDATILLLEREENEDGPRSTVATSRVRARTTKTCADSRKSKRRYDDSNKAAVAATASCGHSNQLKDNLASA